jgi:hypothetical protein
MLRRAQVPPPPCAITRLCTPMYIDLGARTHTCTHTRARQPAHPQNHHITTAEGGFSLRLSLCLSTPCVCVCVCVCACVRVGQFCCLNLIFVSNYN